MCGKILSLHIFFCLGFTGPASKVAQNISNTPGFNMLLYETLTFKTSIHLRASFGLMTGTNFLDFSFDLMRPSLLSKPKTLEAATVVSFTALSQDWVWQSALILGKGCVRNLLRSLVGMSQERTGSYSSSSIPDQSTKLMRESASKLSFGTWISLTEASPFSSKALIFLIASMANSLICTSWELNIERMIFSVWACQAPLWITGLKTYWTLWEQYLVTSWTVLSTWWGPWRMLCLDFISNHIGVYTATVKLTMTLRLLYTLQFF